MEPIQSKLQAGLCFNGGNFFRRELIFASPVCASDSVQELKHLVDQVICLAAPIDFIAVGRWYETFNQVSDEEVNDLLHRAHGM